MSIAVRHKRTGCLVGVYRHNGNTAKRVWRFVWPLVLPGAGGVAVPLGAVIPARTLEVEIRRDDNGVAYLAVDSTDALAGIDGYEVY
jgi:hypothetical protein